jgi:hypothetical protein
MKVLKNETFCNVYENVVIKKSQKPKDGVYLKGREVLVAVSINHNLTMEQGRLSPLNRVTKNHLQNLRWFSSPPPPLADHKRSTKMGPLKSLWLSPGTQFVPL